MQNRQRCSRFSVVNAAYAELPRPVHWIINGIGVLFLAAPHVFSVLSWFLLTWGIDVLQSVLGKDGRGTVFALFDMLKFATSMFTLAFGLEFWSSRAEWAEEVYQILDDSCEEFSILFCR
ncbi:ABC-type multidrug transport system fused ATPase/permease subunit [Paraburkholderia sp. GAS33]|uniref:hypothetical protein n=1 Tax=unclassified Paraburkholderia TaxID=2615204 RepID=UPI003D1E597F